MAYEKHNFNDGDVLSAEHLNAIEDGIVKNEKDIEGKADLDESGKLKAEQLPGTALTNEDLAGAVNTALAQAKESGEFKGDKGDQGDAGYTPVKGVDYFDGKDGQKGADGVSCTHSWNGTSLTVTTASGTSSADLKGEKGDKGADGYTPIKGTDYFTESDKAEMVALVIESLGGNPIFGYVDENNNIVVQGDLADGSYSVKYEMEDGSTVDIGNLILDSNVYYSVTNNLTNCSNSNDTTEVIEGDSYTAVISANSGYELKSLAVTMGGADVSSSVVSGGNISITNVTGDIVITAVAEEIKASYTNLADPSSADWWADSRIGSDGKIRNDSPGYHVTNYIGPLNAGDVIRVKGMDFVTSPKASCPYKSDKTSHGSYGNVILATNTLNCIADKTVTNTGLQFTNTATDVKYWKFTGKLNGTVNDVIITINEPID